ncbi:MAG: hypothetical protein WC352_09290 [Candidatus Omnitrophota bacterium]|jgi:hypothetical protein
MNALKVIRIVGLSICFQMTSAFAQEAAPQVVPEQSSRASAGASAFVSIPFAIHFKNTVGIKFSPILAGSLAVGLYWKQGVQRLAQERMKMMDSIQRARLESAKTRAWTKPQRVDLNGDGEVSAGEYKMLAESLKRISAPAMTAKFPKLTAQLAELDKLKKLRSLPELDELRAKVKQAKNWNPSEA